MDFAANHKRVLDMRQGNTCEWFLQSPVFTNFIARTKKVLWAPGIRMWFSSCILGRYLD
jgi:hypothetical protein